MLSLAHAECARALLDQMLDKVLSTIAAHSAAKSIEGAKIKISMFKAMLTAGQHVWVPY